MLSYLRRCNSPAIFSSPVKIYTKLLSLELLYHCLIGTPLMLIHQNLTYRKWALRSSSGSTSELVRQSGSSAASTRPASKVLCTIRIYNVMVIHTK